MASRRARALLKLGWLLGLPLIVVTGLFAWGVHLGEVHRAEVAQFERDYLAWTGLEPAAGPAAEPAPGQEKEAATAAAAAEAPAAPTLDPGVVPAPPELPPAAPPLPGQLAPDPLGASAAAVGSVAEPEAPGLPPALPGALPEAPGAAPIAPVAPAAPGLGASATTGAEVAPAAPAPSPDPASTAMAAAAASQTPPTGLGVPVVIGVKVLVDDRLASRHPDWMARTLTTIATASRIYRDSVGVELSLVGVVRWPTALSGLDAAAMQRELERHGREGAHVLLGFVAARLGPSAYALGAPAHEDALNGAHGLVGEQAGAELPHLKGVLRSLGHLLGASEVAPGSEGYRLGSWMSEQPLQAGSVPWIDVPNRQRILGRKGRPFEPEAAR